MCLIVSGVLEEMKKMFGMTLALEPVSLLLGYRDGYVRSGSSRPNNILTVRILHKETFLCPGSVIDPNKI